MTYQQITSRTNQHVKQAVRLRERKARRQWHRTLIDGFRELRQAVEAGVRLPEVFVCPKLVLDAESRHWIDQLASRATLYEVTEDVFAKLAFGDRTEGILAVAEPPSRGLADLPAPGGGLVAVMESVEKPGNLGALLRAADAAGVAAVVAADPRTDLYNPAAIRASLGVIFRMAVCQASSDDTLSWIESHKLQLVAADPAGAVFPWELDLTRPTAVVFGSESDGLGSLWKHHADAPMAIPMCGAADSLNVASAAAVVFYEALRQRQQAAASAGPM